MADNPDTAGVLVRPPVAWAVAAAAGLVIGWLRPLPFVPAAAAPWLGVVVFVLGAALLLWASATMTRAGSNIPTSRPTIVIVDTGPYGVTRNPIYLGFTLGLVGLALGFNSLWLLLAAAGFILVIRYGVIAREEAYLERKFGDTYRRYKARVRRWL